MLAAGQSISSDLSLPAVLQRIVEVAREVAGARYAALGVVGPDGGLQEFLQVGMDPTTVQAVGHLPEGRGLLGALVAEPRAVRLPDLEQDPRAVGFPPGHPRMHSFLGVPLRSRNAAFGMLYLADRLGGGEFTQDDEDMVLALATSAGVAIENARLYEEARAQHAWLRAAHDVDQVLLAGEADDLEVLRRIATSVRELAGAEVVVVVLPSATLPLELEVVAAVGAGARDLAGLRCRGRRNLAWRAISTGRAVRGRPGAGFGAYLPTPVPMASSMALPMKGEKGVRGAVVAGRATSSRFSASELDLAESFARRAAIALELADARLARQRLDLLEERSRIAHDLHDHVIQRLFATGLSMQGVVMSLPEGDLRVRTSTAIDQLDETIDRIQTTITTLRDPQVRQEQTRS